MLLDNPFQGSVTGTHYCLFKKYNSKIPTFTPSLLNQNIESPSTICRLQENKMLQKKTATTGRQPVRLPGLQHMSRFVYEESFNVWKSLKARHNFIYYVR